MSDNLTLEQQGFISPHIAAGYRLRERRRQVIKIALTVPMIVELGRQAVDLNAEWRERRQASNAERQALLREKIGREGALDRLSRNIQQGTDDLGHKLTDEQVAEYTKFYGHESAAYDAFEEARKETLTQNREELADIKERREKLTGEINGGTQYAPVWVGDLEKPDGSRLLIRLDNGQVIDRRAAGAPTDQIDLFGEDVEDEPLTEIEYVLAVQGRLQDAAASYSKRHSMLTSLALVVVCRLVKANTPDEELPPELNPDDVVVSTSQPPEPEPEPAKKPKRKKPATGVVAEA